MADEIRSDLSIWQDVCSESYGTEIGKALDRIFPREALSHINSYFLFVPELKLDKPASQPPYVAPPPIALPDTANAKLKIDDALHNWLADAQFLARNLNNWRPESNEGVMLAAHWQRVREETEAVSVIARGLGFSLEVMANLPEARHLIRFARYHFKGWFDVHSCCPGNLGYRGPAVRSDKIHTAPDTQAPRQVMRIVAHDLGVFARRLRQAATSEHERNLPTHHARRLLAAWLDLESQAYSDTAGKAEDAGQRMGNDPRAHLLVEQSGWLSLSAGRAVGHNPASWKGPELSLPQTLIRALIDQQGMNLEQATAAYNAMMRQRFSETRQVPFHPCGRCEDGADKDGDTCQHCRGLCGSFYNPERTELSTAGELVSRQP